jgi:hypothetical protein
VKNRFQNSPFKCNLQRYTAAVAYRVSSTLLSRGFDALERGAGGVGGVPREWHAPLGGFSFGCLALLFPEVTYQAGLALFTTLFCSQNTNR